mmetsp:Transcript_22750/g.58288  ORF Transcript_22750/g.58288 Transcript_22750/m.58288 type:complete len:251 (-) Transcript_22750:320-1072(-)
MASESCCGAEALEPVTSNYSPTGTRHTLGDMEVYTVGSGGPAVVLVYDIFGFPFPQIFQVADQISKAGFTVAVPDVLRGAPWPMEKFPPKPEDGMMAWLQAISDYSKVKADMDAALALLRSECGAAEGRAGAIGFCWGAAMTIQAAADPAYGAIGAAHPSFGLLPDKGAAAAAAAQCPVILLPTKDDDVSATKPVLEAGPFASSFVHRAFDDQVHGFLCARGEWGDPKVAAAATEAIRMIVEFLKANLSA